MTADALQVLVAEDNPDIAELIRATLVELRAWNVTVVSDGFSAVAKAAENRPDLVILDAMMPGIDGIETCRRIKARPSRQPMAVVVLTATAQEHMREEALRAGADRFVTKPFGPNAFCHEMDLALEQARSARSVHRASPPSSSQAS